MNPQRTSHSPVQRRGAFSLIEIMVAVSLLAVIIVGLLAMFYQVQRAFRAGTAQADILEGGRATMNLIVRDLQVMAACRMTNVANCVIKPSTRADGSALDPAVNPTYQDLPTGSRRTNWLQDITFLSRLNDEWMGTTYRVVFGTNGVGTLHRFMELTDRLTLVESNFVAVNNLSRFASATYASYPSNYHRVLDGIVSFDVRAFDTNGLAFPNIDRTSRPANPNIRWSPNITVAHNAGLFAFYDDEVPAYVDIELVILEPSTLAKFRAREDIGQAQATEYLNRQVGKTHVFRQRVAIRPAVTQVSALY